MDGSHPMDGGVCTQTLTLQHVHIVVVVVVMMRKKGRILYLQRRMFAKTLPKFKLKATSLVTKRTRRNKIEKKKQFEHSD